MAEMLKLPEDSDMCPIYCPKHLQKHIDDVKAGNSGAAKLQKNKKPSKAPKAAKVAQSEQPVTSGLNISLNLDIDEGEGSELDLDFSENEAEGEGGSDDDLDRLDFVDEEYESKEPKKRGPKKQKKKVNPEDQVLAKKLREQEKQHKKEQKAIERQKRNEERSIKLQREKEERASERKSRKESKKQQKLDRENEKKKIIVRRPLVGRQLEPLEQQTNKQWKSFMEMGKKREQELIDKKFAKRKDRIKKRDEKDAKKKQEIKKKSSVVVLATKHQKVVSTQKNEAFELAKKQYLEQQRKKNTGIVIKARKTNKQMLKSAPKSIVKKVVEPLPPTDD